MLQESDGEKSDTDLVVDVGKEGVSIFTHCCVYVHYSLVVSSAGRAASRWASLVFVGKEEVSIFTPS